MSTRTHGSVRSIGSSWQQRTQITCKVRRRHSITRPSVFLCLLLLAQACARTIAAGGAEADEGASSQWQVVLLPQADLWYASLALIELNDAGPFPLYDTAFARALREEKQRREAFPTPLDLAAPRLREVLSADPAFDLLNFIPLYYAHVEVDVMLEALRAAAELQLLSELSHDVRAETRIVRRTITTPDQLRALKELVGLVEIEWQLYFQDYWNEWMANAAIYAEAVQAAIDTLMNAGLQRPLDRMGLGRGWVVVSPSLRIEGRFIFRDESRGSGNLVAVSLRRNVSELPIAAGLVAREVCYGVLDRVFERVESAEGPVSHLHRRVIATRCGERVLEKYMPAWLPRYRAALLTAVGSEGRSPDDFARAFPVSDALLAAIDAELDP